VLASLDGCDGQKMTINMCRRLMPAQPAPFRNTSSSGRAVRAFFFMALPLTRRATTTAFCCSRPIGKFRVLSTSTSNTKSESASYPTSAERLSPAAIGRNRPFFRIFYNDVYEVILPKGHRFPMQKYGKVRRRVQEMIAALPPKEQEKVQCDFQVSPLASFEELTTTHSQEYVKNFLSGNQTDVEIRNVGFPWSPSGVNRALSSVGGTVAAACAVCDAIQERRQQQGGDNKNEKNAATWSAHVAGGTHHAFYDRGEGFCVFSDIAVAANVVLERYPDVVQRVLIIDLDVHQGNGNAVLFQGRNDVITFSMHCKKNYFSEVQSSDLDIELPEHCTDQTYLSTLNHWLKKINEEGGEYDLVFYQAGVDVISDDRLGRMSLSKEGVLKRNELIYKWADERGLPLVITMGGGYPKKDWEPILDAHSNVYFSAFQYLACATLATSN
jgi:acetoin utilization deacetylase AcuC-like enzyme